MSEYKVEKRMNFFVSNLQFEFHLLWNEALGGTDTKTQVHSEYMEYYIVEEGSCCVEVDNEVYQLKKGMFAIIGKNVPHRLFNLSDDFKRICFHPTFDKYKYTVLEESMSSCAKNSVVYNISPHMKNCLDYILDYIYNEYEGYISAVESMISAMIFEIFNITKVSLSGEYKNKYKEATRKTVYIIKYIRENLSAKLTAKDIAKHFNLSERQLNHMMLECRNNTAKVCIDNLKVQEAEIILKNTSDTLDIVASKVGFSNEYSFIRFFKRKRGITPNQYRKQYKALMHN